MRTALLLLLSLLPTAALAQIPAPDAPQRWRSEILLDSRLTAGASGMSVRTVTSQDWSFAGTLDAAVGVTYRGRPSAGLTSRLALDLSYPGVPSLLNVGFGFALFPIRTAPHFIRVTAGPTIVLAGTPEMGVGFEADTQWRLGEKLGLAGGIGGYYKRRDAPFAEVWIARATIGASYDF